MSAYWTNYSDVYFGPELENVPGSRANLLKIAEKGDVHDVAKKRNDIEWLDKSKPKQQLKARLEAPHKSATKAVTKSIYDIKNAITTKVSTFNKWFRNPVVRKEMGQNIKAFAKKNKGGIIKSMALLGVTMAASKLRGVNNSGTSINTMDQKTMFGNRSAYLPTSYKRGFNEIKELTTDFGSRVHLDKATTKVMRTARNSSRNGFKTNTAAVINGNVALKAHKNAINHTRY